MKHIAKNGSWYELSGPEHAPVVALIHGLGLDHTTWQDYAPALSASYRVLSYDLFGHGASAAAPRAPSLSVFAEQLHELFDELHIDSAALVGFSLGGMINRRFAIDFPLRAQALVILNSPHERGPEQQRLVEERAAMTSAGGAAATMDSTLERWFTPRFLVDGAQRVAQVRAGVLANDPDSYAQCRMVLANGVIELIRPQPSLTLPTLVMTCEFDSGSTPAMSHAIAGEISAAKSLIVPGLQHMGLVEQPATFLEPVQTFLASVMCP
jgi:(E)-2-((N-methylformamido)methylene)succinate hydrolase